MIAKSNYDVVSDFKGDIPDLVNEILKRDKESKDHTVELSKYLERGTRLETYRAIWKWVRGNIAYVEDAEPQVVKSPGATWVDRTADCKSMAILVGSILQNLKIPYRFKFAFYDQENPEQGHVYVVAPDDRGQWVAIDPVNPVFLDEPKAWKTFTKKGNTKIGKLWRKYV